MNSAFHIAMEAEGGKGRADFSWLSVSVHALEWARASAEILLHQLSCDILSSSIILTPEIKMRRMTRNRIVIVLLAVVLIAPLLEFLDQGNDLNPDSDFVRALVCVFVAISLCLLCRGAISFLPR